MTTPACQVDEIRTKEWTTTYKTVFVSPHWSVPLKGLRSPAGPHWETETCSKSYLLHTAEGTLIVDPVLPKSSEELRALTYRAGKVTAIVGLSPLHERDITEASKHYRAGRRPDVRVVPGDDIPAISSPMGALGRAAG
jgi:hypothetical protein